MASIMRQYEHLRQTIPGEEWYQRLSKEDRKAIDTWVEGEEFERRFNRFVYVLSLEESLRLAFLNSDEFNSRTPQEQGLVCAYVTGPYFRAAVGELERRLRPLPQN